MPSVLTLSHDQLLDLLDSLPLQEAQKALEHLKNRLAAGGTASTQVVGYSHDGQPITLKEQENRLKAAQASAAQGHTLSQDQVKQAEVNAHYSSASTWA